MGHKIRSALCALLTTGGLSTAAADVWVVHDRVLERRDVDGSVVTTVSEPFGTPIGDVIDQGEVDPRTGNVTAESVESRISDRTRAIVVTHLFGNPADLTGIARVAQRHGVPLIEDCAQAFLARTDGRFDRSPLVAPTGARKFVR